MDNSLTQKVSSSDPFQIAVIKGVVAGSVNLALALMPREIIEDCWERTRDDEKSGDERSHSALSSTSQD